MKNKSTNMNTDLHKLFIKELQDIKSAEKQITEALPKLINAASSNKLKQAFTSHLRQTEEQLERLVKIEKELDQNLDGHTCKGMEGLLEEGKEIMESSELETAMDAGLIGAAQRVEHYEIAAYGTAIAHAMEMEHKEIARILKQSLREEEETDKKLTEIARTLNTVADQN